MTDEKRQRTMDFILVQQAQFSINIESLREAQARTDTTVAQLATQVQIIARQQEHMNALIDIVQGRNGQA
jgi:hypothetical protein